ncbi:hypothetical protein GCG54_00015341 [Colletotrichum gloeosporioides]|uniref:Uncharacterized protein n=1 Tax=Colletotrichum gloeosporioides TaxID=474922 RepID=A0A8H4C8M4_COLGL|nr:uncharacterized protein GCG54_00015341 [Colletotrichum gloeosporioides]KAF3799154.1 hypothetical protein GCG54_00015341 [Colletotrichum gloeosporioides]
MHYDDCRPFCVTRLATDPTPSSREQRRRPGGWGEYSYTRADRCCDGLVPEDRGFTYRAGSRICTQCADRVLAGHWARRSLLECE